MEARLPSRIAEAWLPAGGGILFCRLKYFFGGMYLGTEANICAGCGPPTPEASAGRGGKFGFAGIIVVRGCSTLSRAVPSVAFGEGGAACGCGPFRISSLSGTKIFSFTSRTMLLIVCWSNFASSASVLINSSGFSIPIRSSIISRSKIPP